MTFERFATGNCTDPAVPEEVGLDPTGKAVPAVFSLGPNTLSYRATYNGDSNYDPSAVSKCEPVCALNFTKSQ